jgi:hypothetical protein
MTFPFTLVIIELVLVHMVDGRTVQINPAQVTRLQPGGMGKVVTDKVRCVIHLTDGSYTSVVETCDEVRKLLED